MGMANKIPGVSGGIIALAAGFWRMIYSFSRFDTKALQILFKQGFFAFYQHVNGRFLLLLFVVWAGFLSVSLLLDYLLEVYPRQVLGTFLGMIVASVYFIWHDLPKYTVKEYLSGSLGILFGLTLLWINPGTENDTDYCLFCGMVNISGMTLPGLSGSLLILILGNYNLLLVDCVNAFSLRSKMSLVERLGLHDPERRRLLGVHLLYLRLFSRFNRVL